MGKLNIIENELFEHRGIPLFMLKSISIFYKLDQRNRLAKHDKVDLKKLKTIFYSLNIYRGAFFMNHSGRASFDLISHQYAFSSPLSALKIVEYIILTSIIRHHFSI